MTCSIASATTFLFVPGDRPERFEKAVAAGADFVIVDLEDAVAPDSKRMAREALAAWLDPIRPVMVRINGFDSPLFEADLALCTHPAVSGVVLPKAEPGAALARTAALRPTLALIETAVGARALDAIANTPGVERLGIGAFDLLLDLDITAPEAVLDPILLQIVVASRAAGIASPVAGVTSEFRDPVPVIEHAARSRSIGFGGKLCIHPAQIAPTLRGFRPSHSAIEHARRVIAADTASGGAAVALDGQMVDRPMVDRARRVLVLAG